MFADVCFLLIAVICLYATLAGGLVLRALARVKKSEAVLRRHYKKKAALCFAALSVIEQTYARDAKIVVRLRDASGALSSALSRAEALRGAAKADEACSAALSAFNKFLKIYPLLRETENYSAVLTEIALTDEKIAFAKQFYNKDASAFNKRVNAPFAAPLRNLLRVNGKREI